jgi:phosphate starvation-inducible membrane PsiE
MADTRRPRAPDTTTDARTEWRPPWRRRRIGPAGRLHGLDGAIGLAELSIYAVVAVLLAAAGAFTIVGTISDVVEGGRVRAITDTGVFLLDRILLLFIFAELLYTLRLVSFRGRILVEPFLFIGLIAVVRRILVITAEADLQQGGDALDDFLIQVAVLSGLVLVLALAIALLRHNASQQP